jgi:ATP-binding cassette subfamily B protein
MQRQKLKYLLAIVCIIFAACFSFITPLIVRFTVDSVLGGKPVSLPFGIEPGSSLPSIAETVRHNLWVAALAIILISVTGHLFTYLRGKLSAQVSEEFARRLRDGLYDHIQRLPYAWHSKVQTGDIIQRCTSDVETVRRFIGQQLVQLGRGIFMAVLILPVMLSLNVRMTVISTIVIPVIFVYAYVFFRQVRKRFQAADEAEGYMTTVLEESLNGIRVVRAFAREDFEIARFETAADDYRAKCRRLITILAWYWASSDLLCLLQIATVFIVGIGFTIRGQISLGTLLAFSTYIGMLLWPIREMGRILTDLGRALVSTKRLREIMETPVEEMAGRVSIPVGTRLKGAIGFHGVSFAYDPQQPILNHVDLDIKAGETIAILGSTGSGKSTLTNLIPRLFDGYEGKIILDGVELRDYDRQDLRRQIGIVLQEPFLYSRTLAENIGMAVPDCSITKIEHAAMNAALDECVREFPDGYDTVLGERGITLSGGQRQRAAIARALVRDPAILILDDALSAVDSETEQIIQRNLQLRKGRSTTIIITHRLTSVALADRVVVLEHGRIAQIGTHEELVKKPGAYQRVWNIQHLLEQEAG